MSPPGGPGLSGCTALVTRAARCHGPAGPGCPGSPAWCARPRCPVDGRNRGRAKTSYRGLFRPRCQRSRPRRPAPAPVPILGMPRFPPGSQAIAASRGTTLRGIGPGRHRWAGTIPGDNTRTRPTGPAPAPIAGDERATLIGVDARRFTLYRRLLASPAPHARSPDANPVPHLRHAR